MAKYSNSPLFAGRYSFQLVSNDWDHGRSGFTHLVFDRMDERMGVIKRAGIRSQQAVEGLKNEVGALLDLRGLSVPEVYDTGEASYGSKNYFYLVMEYIEGIRVERNLNTLSAVERAEILTQLFGLLSKAHRTGIVNGDVDIKHLFWRRDQNQLVVIDWGNAKLHLDWKQKTEFAFDLARSAEIIYSLTTSKGHLPVTGSLALPKDAGLFPGLAPVPQEYRELCNWAPRAPSNSIAPHNAQELFAASKLWNKSIHSNKLYKASAPLFGRAGFLPWFFGFSFLCLLMFFVFFDGLEIIQSSLSTPTYTSIGLSPSTPTITLVLTPTSSQTGTLIETQILPTQLASTLTAAPITAIIPSPRPYSEQQPIQVFDNNLSPAGACWQNDTNASTGLTPLEGFNQREDGNWRFGIEKDRSADVVIQTDLRPCIDTGMPNAFALNAWIARLELVRELPDIPGAVEPGKEFGIFLEDTNGQRREYSFWLDRNENMYFRLREGNVILQDALFLMLNNLRIERDFPRFYSTFAIQIFFEKDNQGLDILYVREGPFQSPAQVVDLHPSKMMRLDNMVRPTLGTIQKIGLLGRGGETQTILWPLVFYGN